MPTNPETSDPSPSLRDAHSRAIDAILSGSDIDAAATAARVEPETLRAWSDDDAEFIVAMNRAKQERSARLRAELRALASEAMTTLREMMTSPSTPNAVRLRAALAVLGTTDAMTADKIGSTSEAGRPWAGRKPAVSA